MVSIVFKEVLYQYTVFKGRKLNSRKVVANAWHHRSDAFFVHDTAAGRYRWRHSFGDHWRVLDPVAAVIVSFFIMKVAVQLLIPCVMDELLEKSLPAEVEDEILKTILSFPVIKPRRITFVRAASTSAVIVPSRCMRMDGIAGGSSRDSNGGGEQAERQFGKEHWSASMWSR